MVVKNLQPQYLKHVYPQPITTFKQLQATGLQVEDGLNLGLLDKGETPQPKKPYTS